jgi:hypothetical protein
VPEARSLTELVAAGWTEADLDWENAIEAAVAALAAGDTAMAGEGFGECIRIARAFGDFDPRLGTSCANRAGALVSAGRAEAAGLLARDARRAWHGCDDWVAAMTAPRTARSSVFHMRMEQRHRGAYEERWREKWAAWVGEARARLSGEGALALATPPDAGDALGRWRRERPAMLNDTRKLMAAVLLLVVGRNHANQRFGSPPTSKGTGEIGPLEGSGCVTIVYPSRTPIRCRCGPGSRTVSGDNR